MYVFPSKGKTNPIVLTVHVNRAVLPIELDTGASLSVISEDIYKSIFNVTDQLKQMFPFAPIEEKHWVFKNT